MYAEFSVRFYEILALTNVEGYFLKTISSQYSEFYPIGGAFHIKLSLRSSQEDL